MKSALKPAATEPPAPAARAPLLPRLFDGLFGAFLGLCLLKFPNPPLPAFERWVTVPTNGWEFALNSWPIAWGYRLLGLLAVVGLFSARWKFAAPRWLVFLPLAWLFWQVVAGTQTIAPALTKPTLAHLAACVVCFYLGCFCLERDRNSGWFWLGVACAFVLVLAVGIQQRFGGLEETRRYFMLYQYPQMQEVPAEYLKRLSSDRIFATLFYPNALAGLVLLLLPPVLSAVANARRLFTPGARTFIASAIGLSACACLYWSGSKGGWLLMLVLGMVAVLRLPLGKRARTQVLCAMLLLGLAGFFLKYSGFFHKGATSVSARFDYWKAALRTVEERPFFGTGAGTFSIAYERFRPPQAEPSRLVHNDYLEQASDSGLPGFVLYSTFIVAAVFWGYRNGRANWHNFWVWLGVVGWALQGLLEFGLYIPALAWPAFALLGWLVGQNPKPTSPELD